MISSKPVYKPSQEAIPFAVIGSNTVLEVRNKRVRGRMYPWGVVEIENPEHCDFTKLRTMLMFVFCCLYFGALSFIVYCFYVRDVFNQFLS